ncbi:hypothetical protein [Methylomonas sp. AM2-LC]|uniref:hypothetical protein n=1 Tax=Methylomonas sp. AM2-LC TaxID=3153301 RepID=UPI0032665DDA
MSTISSVSPHAMQYMQANTQVKNNQPPAPAQNSVQTSVQTLNQVSSAGSHSGSKGSLINTFA